MASQVYNTEEIELQDGTTVVLKPLPLKQLRKAMDSMTEWQQTIADAPDGDYDAAKAGEWQVNVVAALIKIAAVCLSKQRPDLLEDDAYEDILDVDSSYKIIEICMGVKLNDDSGKATTVTASGGMI